MADHQVYDYETLKNCTIVVFEHYQKNEIKVFVIHESRNDFPQLYDFLQECRKDNRWQISFNGLAFDSQIHGFILENADMFLNLDGDSIARHIYQFIQDEVIGQQSFSFGNRYVPLPYPEWNLPFSQIDLYKMNHWDSGAKNCSLKWVQYSLDWPNVQEMPIHHSTEVTAEQIPKIVEYCINDVATTKAALNKSKKLIALRKTLTEEYDINLFSASEPRISKELFAHFLSQKLGIEKKVLKKMRTQRDKVVCDDIIVPYVKFETKECQAVEQWFRNLVIDYNDVLSDEERKKKYKFKTTFKGCKTDFGLGGIHGVKPGIHKAGNGQIVMTSDVTSFYPNLAIRNKWAPAHFDANTFCDLYEWFFEERKKIPKSDPLNYVYKLILNSTYGLSSDENSFLLDKLFTMKITVNGQLSLLKLYEMLILGIPGAQPLMFNTDGLEMMIPEQYKQKYMDICAEWEKMTQLGLEHDEYQKLILWDVNNYIGINVEKKAKNKQKFNETVEDAPHYPTRISNFEPNDRGGYEVGYYYTPVKVKGRFEWPDQDKKKIGVLHKNKSFLVKPKAIYHYFVNGIKPEDYLETNTNIFDYCGGAKAKGQAFFELHAMIDGVHRTKNLNKLVRYYVGNDGSKLLKQYGDGRKQQVEAGSWKIRVFNKAYEADFEDYDVNHEYYLQGIYKEINAVDHNVTRHTTQLELFAA